MSLFDGRALEFGKPLTDAEIRRAARHRLEHERAGKMRRKFGPGPEGQTCKGCRWLVHGGGGDGRFLKCARYANSRSEATDWRAKWLACGKYEAELKSKSTASTVPCSPSATTAAPGAAPSSTSALSEFVSSQASDARSRSRRRGRRSSSDTTS